MASASASSMVQMSYSDCFQGFPEYRSKCSIRYGNCGTLPLPALSFLSIHQRNHTEYLRVIQRPPVVCARHPKTVTVTHNSWEKLVVKNETPVLVEFYASWCGPCQMVHRVIDEISVEFKGKLECFVLNTDNDLDLAEEYDIKAVPVVLLFKNGRKHDAVIGTMPKEFYVAAIEKMLAS